MSKLICSDAITGAIQWVAKAEDSLSKAIKAKGENYEVRFPETAYFLPVIYSFSGVKIEKLGDMLPVLKQAKDFLYPRTYVP